MTPNPVPETRAERSAREVQARDALREFEPPLDMQATRLRRYNARLDAYRTAVRRAYAEEIVAGVEAEITKFKAEREKYRAGSDIVGGVYAHHAVCVLEDLLKQLRASPAQPETGE